MTQVERRLTAQRRCTQGWMVFVAFFYYMCLMLLFTVLTALLLLLITYMLLHRIMRKGLVVFYLS